MKEFFFEKKIFDAKLENLYPMIIWVKERAYKYFPQKALEKIELATEEAVVNIIKHAYKKTKGKIEIEILVDKKHLHLTFKDKGPKFNPLSVRQKVDKTKSLTKRKKGGFGIFLIFECVDEVKYIRKDHFNILTLQKKRNPMY